MACWMAGIALLAVHAVSLQIQANSSQILGGILEAAKSGLKPVSKKAPGAFGKKKALKQRSAAGPCLLYTEKYCNSAPEMARLWTAFTIDACKTACAGTSGCTHFSSTIKSGDCLMYTECGSQQLYGDGTMGTKTYSMAPCPTPAPTPSPGGSGDPHVVNVRGQHFEVFQLGEHTLVHLPRSAPANETLLDVKVKIAPCNHDLFSWNCKSRFIEDVNISGSLIGEKKSVHFSAGKLIEKQEILTARSGDGKLWHHKHDLHFDLHSSKYGPVRMTATTGKAGTGMKLHLGDAATIFIQSKQSKFKNAGKKDVHWLDVSVRGLQNLGGDIGGLLGLDDHTKAAAVPEECTGLKEKMMQKISSGAPPRTAVQGEAGMA